MLLSNLKYISKPRIKRIIGIINNNDIINNLIYFLPDFILIHRYIGKKNKYVIKKNNIKYSMAKRQPLTQCGLKEHLPKH